MFPEAELVRDFPFNPYLTIDPVVGAKVTQETNMDDGISVKWNDRWNNGYLPVLRTS